MSSRSPQAGPSWTTRLRRSWERWLRTKQLKRAVRKLRRQVRRQEQLVRLRVEMLELLEQLEHPPLLVALPPMVEPKPVPPPLTPEEIEEIRALPMPDPLEEIEHRLGLSTTPPSQRISAP